MKILKKTNTFTILTQFLVIILPFYVILKLSFENQLGIPFFGFFIKELVIVALFLYLLFQYIKEKRLPKFELLDYLIFAYFAYGIAITLINGLGISSLIYGGRYDFLFLVVFLIYRHGKIFLKTSTNKLIELFLISGALSLFLGLVLKFIIGEEFLQIFGYSIYVADWQFKGGIPIYHGVEASGIRRFQGILDGPNAMGFFILVYSGLFLHLFRKTIEYHIVLVFIILFLLLLITYSRSALLGAITAVSILIAINLKGIFKKYKKQASLIILFLVGFSLFFFTLFQDRIHNIFLRSGSTQGHFDRMGVGIDRFLSEPMGQGLASAGPAFRAIFPEKITKVTEMYYIPESWFIQQLIEGGVIYFILFILIFAIILAKAYKKSKPLFGALVGVLIMNIFLHSFEATYISILFFLFLGLILKKK